MKKYTKIMTVLTGTALLATFVISPAFTFAKENDKGNKGENEKKEQNKNNKGDDKNNKGCFKAFGHLIAPGWIKHNGQLSVGEECHLPFGIGKKFRGDHSTTTPPTATTTDTTAPVISNLTSATRPFSAVVRWTTNEKSDTAVFFSTASPVVTTGNPSVVKAGLVRDHQITIQNLAASTTYYAVVRSKDAAGNTTLSSQFSFITKSPVVNNDTTAPVITSIVSVTGTTSVKVGWTTNEFATSRVYYSTNATVDVNATTTAFVDRTALEKSHLLNITGLTASTTYYLIVESVDASGNISRSAVFPATTGTVPVVVDATAPLISNAIAVVGSTTVQLSWNTNENSTTKAYYSTTTPVDVNATSTVAVENISLVTSHALTVSNLATSTTYYMVLESKDSSGNTGRAAQFSFTTSAGI